MRDGPILTLADLEDFDRESSGKDRDKSERRFCCPECGPQYLDKHHRNLSLNTKTGEWHCHRCIAGGTLREHWQPRQDRTRATLRRVFELHPDPPPTAPPAANGRPAGVGADPWRAIWDAGRTLAGTPGAAYLAGRGIPAALADLAGVRYTPDCWGRPAVLCPIVDQAGQIVAFNGRYTDQRTDPKARSGGPKKTGVFATPGALAADLLVLTEAPIDALSLAACGVPAVALCGTTGPAWLPGACVLRTVALAFDSDDAGDTAADQLRPLLESLGATVERWRPNGAKDWNDALGAGALAWQLFELGIDPPEPTPSPPGKGPAERPRMPWDAR